MTTFADGDRVRAKRIGWRGDNVTDVDILDPYDYTAAETVVEGTLHLVDADGPFVEPHTNYLVDGQVVDPDTIEPLTVETASTRRGIAVIPEGFLKRGLTVRITKPENIRTVVAAADDEPHDGGMIALLPEVDDARRLALGGDHAETQEELHVTLAYLGDAVDWVPEARSVLVDRVKRTVEELRYDVAVIGTVFGVNLWNLHGDEPSVNLAVGGDDLNFFHQFIWITLNQMTDPRVDEGLTPELPEQHSPWVPHICLGYADNPELRQEFAERASDPGRFGPVAFDRVRIAFGDDVTDVPITHEA